MTRLLLKIFGYIRIRVKGAAPEYCLNRMTQKHVPFWDIHRIDPFTMEISILRSGLMSVRRCAERTLCEVEVRRELGAARELRGLRKRTLLLSVIFVAIAAAIILPKFVCFYKVSGNERVPSAQILRAVEGAGVGFFTYGPSIDPQDVKNHVLAVIPELQWLTVTQNGVTAEIVVRERPEKSRIVDRRTPQNVIASRDGIITDVTVMEGGCLCAVGETVRAGQLLVSGYVDCEYKTRVCGALAEIYARTWRGQQIRIPSIYQLKKDEIQTEKTWSLVIGRKRMKIFGKTGIMSPSCDKITRTIPLALPGQFILPIALEIETRDEYVTEETTFLASEVEEILKQVAQDSARDDMIAGTIDRADYQLRRGGGCYTLHSMLECTEMIARMVPAGIFKSEG